MANWVTPAAMDHFLRYLYFGDLEGSRFQHGQVGGSPGTSPGSSLRASSTRGGGGRGGGGVGSNRAVNTSAAATATQQRQQRQQEDEGRLPPAASQAGVDTLMCLLRLSDMYQLTHLKETVEARLARGGVLTIDSVCAIAGHAMGCHAYQVGT